jgi:hypothetical protein
MPDTVWYIRKDGKSVDIAIVRRRFFETALVAGVDPDKACGIWNDAVFGNRRAPDYREPVRYRNRRG